MTSRLKNLYKHLIENREHELKGWHDDYEKFYKKVKEIRARLNDGENLNSNDNNDLAFLNKLLREKDNRISSRGQSSLSKDDFKEFIKDEKFMSALEAFIKTPDHANFKNFAEAWSAQGKGNNPLLINRVAAACTTNVSTTVHSNKFDQVFEWLISEKIILKYPEEKPQDWYSKNTFLMKKIHKELKDELEKKETDEFYLSIFVWEIYKNLSNPFYLKKQVIKYGPPGTGKTYQARQQTEQQFDTWKEEFASGSNDSDNNSPDSKFTYESQIELVQFHPSFTYEDFMEGLRPVPDAEGTVQLKLQNGVFKEFCRKAGQWEIDLYNLDPDLDLEKLTIKDLRTYEKDLSDPRWKHIFDLPDSYSSKLVSEAVPPFFFIIDEVNRAELSRVFGELMYCLEYRGIKGTITTQYANLNNEETGMLKTEQGYKFFIPTNVYLIGTMNTIDRSIESFDFALRRRFRWEEVTPDTTLLKYHLKELNEEWAPLAVNLENLNEKIAEEPLLGPDYQIGHAYLMNLNYPESLTLDEVKKNLWDDCIKPLLQEYLRGTGKENELIGSFRNEFFKPCELD